jgi:hypothetical protein
MHPIIRLAFLVTPVLVAVGGTLKAQQPSSVRTNADSGLASVQLARLPTELPSGAAFRTDNFDGALATLTANGFREDAAEDDPMRVMVCRLWPIDRVALRAKA